MTVGEHAFPGVALFEGQALPVKESVAILKRAIAALLISQISKRSDVSSFW